MNPSEKHSEVKAHTIKPGLKRHPQVKNVIAIASGKGGVGKSTITANLALALQATGVRVGVLDADIYGPSQHKLLGVNTALTSPDQKSFNPIRANNIDIMSIAFLQKDDDTPMIWRGPMVSSALEQMFFKTNWQDLDYLLVDFPPGTGDIPLTMVQKIPLTAALMVTTPQDIALLDVRKALMMFQKLNIEILGVVENMATYSCSSCGHSEHLFGKDGGRELAQSYNLPLLASFPLDLDINKSFADKTTFMQNNPDSNVAREFAILAGSVQNNLAKLKIDYSDKFSKIVVE